MQFPDSFFEDEVRCGFYVPAIMKRCWAAQLEVLAEVDRVCTRYNIQWWAFGGTLLGAVRHGGFIPWDDDVDICMLREDYIRFNMVAEKELSDGFYIPQDRDINHRFLTRVFCSANFGSAEKYLERFHNFPFSPGIDIFPLDGIAPDPFDDEFQNHLITIAVHAANKIHKDNQNTEESKALISQIEGIFNRKLDRDSPIKEQLFSLIENLCSLYTVDESNELTVMLTKYNRPSYRFPKECFQDTVFLPFETLKIPAPAAYDKILHVEFGDYQQLIRGGGDHTYPYFLHSTKNELTADVANNLLRKYSFSAEDLEKSRVHGVHPKKHAEDFILLTDKIHKAIYQNLQDCHIQAARELLEACQNAALRVGTMIEQTEGEGCPTVKLLEQYCELIYQTYEELAAGSSSVPDSVQLLIRQRLDEMHRAVTDSTDNIAHRKEILFLPYKASMWGPMEPVWKKAVENPDCHVSVVPIPYYYSDANGYATNMQYEGALFPDYVPITDYKNYDLKNRQPDKIIIHNPYDEYNLTTSVHPFFYASNLKLYTDCLIYLPCFPVDEFSRDDLKSWYNMQFYVAMPGVVHADLVAVPSPQTRQIYIDYLTEFAGEDTRQIWEKKIAVLEDSIF